MDKVERLLALLIAIGVVGTLLGVNPGITDTILGWVCSLLAGTLISLFLGSLIVNAGGGFLQGITISIPIGENGFSITAFAVVVVGLKCALF